jgi:nitrate reductase NapE component
LCYDYKHYWPSELCSTWHEGRELEDGWYCYPDQKDSYCSYKGTCTSDGMSCECDDPDHYWADERCSEYHSSVSPSPTPFDPCGCNGEGKCAADGVTCECYNYHYYPSEKCAIWHEGRQLQDGWYCYPDAKDSYCNYMGTCSSDGMTCVCDDTDHRSSDTRCAEWHPAPTLSPTPPSTTCVPGEEAYCHDNGKCDEAGDKCMCYDYQHYWPSEQCSTWHEGRELEDGWYCFPGQEKDSYCSYMGTCSADGSYCVCDDPIHRSSDTRCGEWHPAPTTAPTVKPTYVATQKPTKAPTAVVCTPGNRRYCNNRGYCDSTGDGCVCDDELHYWPSEQCEWWHMGRELEEGQFCYPEKKDVYCRWMGTCTADGMACECLASWLSPAHRCSLFSLFYDDDGDASQDALSTDSYVVKKYFASVAADEEVPATCETNDRHYCNDRGTCLSPEEGCSCDDPVHFWAADNCKEFHYGVFLEADQCCMPGAVDYYCSWLGTCDPTGRFCECFEPDHRLSAERCATFYEDLADAPDVAAVDECPALVEVNEASTSGSNSDNNSNHKHFLTAAYVLVPILAVSMVAAALIVYRSRYIAVHQKPSNADADEGLSMRYSASAESLRKSAVANPMSDP